MLYDKFVKFPLLKSNTTISFNIILKKRSLDEKKN